MGDDSYRFRGRYVSAADGASVAIAGLSRSICTAAGRPTRAVLLEGGVR